MRVHILLHLLLHLTLQAHLSLTLDVDDSTLSDAVKKLDNPFLSRLRVDLRSINHPEECHLFWRIIKNKLEEDGVEFSISKEPDRFLRAIVDSWLRSNQFSSMKQFVEACKDKYSAEDDIFAKNQVKTAKPSNEEESVTPESERKLEDVKEMEVEHSNEGAVEAMKSLLANVERERDSALRKLQALEAEIESQSSKEKLASNKLKEVAKKLELPQFKRAEYNYKLVDVLALELEEARDEIRKIKAVAKGQFDGLKDQLRSSEKQCSADKDSLKAVIKAQEHACFQQTQILKGELEAKKFQISKLRADMNMEIEEKRKISKKLKENQEKLEKIKEQKDQQKVPVQRIYSDEGHVVPSYFIDGSWQQNYRVM